MRDGGFAKRCGKGVEDNGKEGEKDGSLKGEEGKRNAGWMKKKGKGWARKRRVKGDGMKGRDKNRLKERREMES